MYKVLLGTNALVDFSLGREPGCSAVKQIIVRADEGQCGLLATAASVKDCHYIIQSSLKRAERKESGEVTPASARAASEAAWACTRLIMRICTVVPVGQTECYDAFTLRSLHEDFEDDLVVAAARQVGADFLVTGDDRLRRCAPIACLSPQELESLLEAEAQC